MASRRESITMSETEVAAYLEEQKVLNVATIGVSGHPHVVAMWYVLLDGKPAFWTFGKSQKVVNIRRDPKITGLVESGASYDQLRGVELVGTARLLEDYEQVLDLGVRVATKYQGPPSAEALPFVEAQARKRIGIVIDVERTVTWDHTKLAGAY
jgi:nitroimidazol reductase NimA-like FMN-containing flavoprotein (pyridoxamine 5'-phosphate oxidase superfamily)